MKCNSQIILLCSWLNNENQIWKPHDFFFNLAFGDLKLPQKKLSFLISPFGQILIVLKKGLTKKCDKKKVSSHRGHSSRLMNGTWTGNKNGNLAIPEGPLTFGDWKPPRKTSIWNLEYLISPFFAKFGQWIKKAGQKADKKKVSSQRGHSSRLMNGKWMGKKIPMDQSGAHSSDTPIRLP